MGVIERVTAVLLPGTGSDEVFVREVFGAPLAAVGVDVRTPAPRPGAGLVDAQLAALDAAAAAAGAPVLVGGISLGAHVAARWAAEHPARCAGLLLALPGWLGAPDGAPAAVMAVAGARAVREHGVSGALDAATADVAPWLADELRRAWTGYRDGLADSLAVAASYPAPTAAELAALAVPAGVAGCTDDPVHPLAVAEQWTAALPRAVLHTTRLAVLGADRAALGRAAVLGWLHAGGRVPPTSG